MKYLFYDEKGKVNLIWYMLVDEKTLQDTERVIEYDGDIPEKENHRTEIYVDLKTKEVSFEFIEVNEVDDVTSEIEKLKEDNELLSDTLAIILDEIYGGDE